MAQEITVRGSAGVSAVKPTASVFSRPHSARFWRTGGNGFLEFDGWVDRGAGYVSDADKWLMLTDPQVYAALQLRRGAAFYDGVQILPAVPYGDQRYERAKEIADLNRFYLADLDCGFLPLLMQMAECDWWRNCAADLIFGEKTVNGKQTLGVCAMDVHLSEDYFVWRQGHRAIGLQPVNNSEKIYPMEKFMWVRFRPNSRYWLGTDLASVVWTPFYMKNQGHPENLKYMALFSNPSLVGKAPEDVTTEVPLLSPFKDQFGRQIPLKDDDDNPILISPQEAMALGLQNFQGAGGYTVIPPKSDLKMMEAQGDGRIFVTFEDARDWQIMTGILGTGNMTGRAKYGSNASAQTGENSVAKPVDMDAQTFAAAIRTSLCRPMTRWNFPESDWDLVPQVVVNGNRSFLEQLFVSIMANSVYGDERFVSELAGRLGVPMPDMDAIQERLAQPKPVGTVGENE